MKIKINNANEVSFVKIDNITYIVKKSTKLNKKYDVFDLTGKYLLSFGDSKYQQFHDKLNMWSWNDHNDYKRRNLYRKRAEGIGNLDNVNSANFWSYNMLW